MHVKNLTVLLMTLVILVSAIAITFAKQEYDPDIDPADFVSIVDNPFFPLTPGTTMIYEGETEDGLTHVEDYVTYNTVTIMDVTCIEVLNREWLDGELIEETQDWYAQDIDGNVWYFGEYATEYDNGDVSHEGSWTAGVDDALPGIIMLANPQKSDRYRQEYYEGEAEDMAKVQALDGTAEIVYGIGYYEDLLVTKEWTLLEPGNIEYKYYASGIGMILEIGFHGGQESIELVDITTD